MLNLYYPGTQLPQRSSCNITVRLLLCNKHYETVNGYEQMLNQ